MKKLLVVACLFFFIAACGGTSKTVERTTKAATTTTKAATTTTKAATTTTKTATTTTKTATTTTKTATTTTKTPSPSTTSTTPPTKTVLPTTTVVSSTTVSSMPALVDDSLPTTQALANGKEIVSSFNGNGTSVLDPLNFKGQYSLIIASDSGPLKVSLENDNESRLIYDRPEGNGVGTYETSASSLEGISVAIDASDSVSWILLVVPAMSSEDEIVGLGTSVAGGGTILGECDSSAISGYKTLYIGHSFGKPFAERLMEFARNSEIDGHCQNIVFRSGNDKGNPQALWSDETARSEIQEILDEGDIDLLVMICCSDTPADIESYWAFPKWIDYSLSRNSDTRFALALPWLDSPQRYETAEIFSTVWNLLHERIWHTILDNLRESYPEVDIFGIPHGLAAVELRSRFETGNLDDVNTLIGNNDNSIFRDGMGHSAEILHDLGTLVWLGSIYDIDLSVYPSGNDGKRIDDYTVDLRLLAESILSREASILSERK